MLYGTKTPPNAPRVRPVSCQNLTHYITLVFSYKTSPCSKFKDSWGFGLGVLTNG
jgi:hypothetical protein